jgi:hypothetical protein
MLKWIMLFMVLVWFVLWILNAYLNGKNDLGMLALAVAFGAWTSLEFYKDTKND